MNIIFLLLTFLMSGEVFSQSSRSKNTKKVRPVQVEEKPTNEITTIEPQVQGKARLDTKDGSMYLGEFISENDNSYSIQIINGDTITLEKNKVRKAKTPNSAIVFNKGKYHPISGAFIHYSFGSNAGNSGGGIITDIGLGYRMSKKLEIITGLGILGTTLNVIPGLNQWAEYKTFFPAYIGMNYNLTHNSVRIFTSAKAGFSSSPLDNFNWGGSSITTSGGAYFEPGIGLSFASKRFGRLNLSMTQILQRTNLKVDGVDNFDNLVSGGGKIWISRIGFRITTTLF